MRTVGRFVGALAITTVAVWSCLALGLDLHGPRPPLLAVALAATLWGVGPGLAAWATSTAGYAFAVAAPRWSFAIARAQDRDDLLEFAVESAFVALVVGTIRLLYLREREGRRQAATVADRLGRLQAVTASLSAARTPAEAAEVVLGQGAELLGATAAAVGWLVAKDELEFLAWRGYDEAAMRRFQRVGTGADMPAARAFRERAPVYVEDHAAMLEYEELARLPDEIRRRFGAVAALPLLLQGRAVGALSLAFAGPRRFSEGERSFLEALAGQCAQALDRARLFEAERAQRESAERAARQRDEVLEVVAHDLRSPLNAVQLRAGALERTPGAAGEAARAVAASAARMERLIEDLLDVAALDAGRLSLVRAREDAGRLAAEALGAVRPQAEQARVGLATTVAADLPPVLADRGRTLQILDNLLSNALHASSPGATVTLAVLPEAGAALAVRFEVRDEGPGLPPEDLAHVFERFRRSRGARQQGTGLGLAIARGLAEAHGGRVEAAARTGGGSTFALILPASR